MEHLKSKIRVLVTHQIQFIEKASKILILKDGNCLAYGSFSELQQMGIDFMSLLAEPENKDDDNDPARDRTTSERSISSIERRNSVSTEAMKGRSRTLSVGQVETFQVQEVRLVANLSNELIDLIC